MRIQQLNLLRYGKFTGRVLALPAAPRDFHFVVGANEAGKSTTRSAILDLLYGIETRSTFDFVHAKADMRLGATLQHAGQALDFVRVKARLKTLQAPDGSALPETALAAFLGGSDRAFFDQMFGLDHQRLQAGGNAILSAHNDVGQILFQSAAGIASLGTVRDQLAQEADSLWARRRANDRVYYAASDDLARAEAALKAATVRTKDWVDAQERVKALEERRQALAQQVRTLEAERLQLERVRRVAPALAQWHEHGAALALLAQAVLLPEQAAAQLADTELALAAAGRDQQLLATQVQALAAQLAGVVVDDALLKHQADIQALAERRQQVRHHERDIDRRRLELAAHALHVQSLLRQLGWPEGARATHGAPGDEGLPTTPLPSLPARAALADLARQHAVLQQADEAAAALLADKAAECQALRVEIEGGTGPLAPAVHVPDVPEAPVPPLLRTALAEARALGDAPAALARDQALLARCQRELATATAALGPWAAEPARLRQQVLPSQQDLLRRQHTHLEAQAACLALADKQAELASAVHAQALLVTQYRNAHQPITWAELQAERARRDGLWAAVKAGVQTALGVAAELDHHIAHADQLADQRHDKAQAVGELQARQDALDRLQQQATDTTTRLGTRQAEHAVLQADWAAAAQGAGVPGLPLHDAPAWCAARAQALHAADMLAEAAHTVQATQQRIDASAASLRVALAGSSTAAPTLLQGMDWPALLVLATDAVDAATAAHARLQELHKQRGLAGLALARQQDKAQAARAAYQAWQRAWRAAATAAGLPADTGVAAAEGALAVMASIDTKLREMQEIRHARIDTMQRDLRDFEQDVARVSAQAAPALVAPSAADAAQELAALLARAQTAQQEATRLQRDLAACQAQAQAADARVAQAGATLQPLLHQAGVSSRDTLRDAIALSDRRRALQAAAESAQQAVRAGSDGIALPALQDEVNRADAAQAPLRVAEISQALAALRPAQDALTAEHTEASAALARIAGGADAARAESDRQDALAKMANAAERYIQVHTASRLLKWAIDRYRETRQGPMLQRAGEVFSALTLGSFTRLSVDFDSEPLALHGQRESGPPVAVAGMSEGTRDQLYLALRLAALELHLDTERGQGHALPFIADDLFINYDDGRAQAGLAALARLSEQTQVIFLSHHDHLLPAARAVFGPDLNVVQL
jgi:uncharacterized protein YhaN